MLVVVAILPFVLLGYYMYGIHSTVPAYLVPTEAVGLLWAAFIQLCLLTSRWPRLLDSYGRHSFNVLASIVPAEVGSSHI